MKAHGTTFMETGNGKSLQVGEILYSINTLGCRLRNECCLADPHSCPMSSLIKALNMYDFSHFFAFIKKLRKKDSEIKIEKYNYFKSNSYTELVYKRTKIRR